MDGYGARSPRVNRAPRNRGSGRRAILEIASNMRRVEVEAKGGNFNASLSLIGASAPIRHTFGLGVAAWAKAV